LLYMLSVGPVRGFAFYLVLAEVFDLLTSRYYLYPAMLLLCRSKLTQNRPGLFGLPGVDMTASNLATAGAEARTIARRPSRTKGTDRQPAKAAQGDESAGDDPVRVPSDTSQDESSTEGSSS